MDPSSIFAIMDLYDFFFFFFLAGISSVGSFSVDSISSEAGSVVSVEPSLTSVSDLTVKSSSFETFSFVDTSTAASSFCGSSFGWIWAQHLEQQSPVALLP